MNNLLVVGCWLLVVGCWLLVVSYQLITNYWLLFFAVMSRKIWLQPQIIDWTQILLDSFERLLGYQLISRVGDKQEQAIALFNADFVVVSHGIEADPILNYGNQKALDLWGMDWADFTETSSRLTAEPVNRVERSAMLQQAQTKGYIDNYRGVRIASTGQRFKIEQAIIWNLEDSSGNNCGQAATFAYWQTLE